MQKVAVLQQEMAMGCAYVKEIYSSLAALKKKYVIILLLCNFGF